MSLTGNALYTSIFLVPLKNGHVLITIIQFISLHFEKCEIISLSTRTTYILLAPLLWWPCTIYNNNPIICLLQLVDKVDDKHVSYIAFTFPANAHTYQHGNIMYHTLIEAALLQYMYWYVTWSSNEGRRIVCFSGFWQHIIPSTTNKPKGLVLLRTYSLWI